MSDAIFTRSEVSMHCGEDDCWIIVGNYVYDVTKFVDLHPGGPEILLEFVSFTSNPKERQDFHFFISFRPEVMPPMHSSQLDTRCVLV